MCSMDGWMDGFLPQQKLTVDKVDQMDTFTIPPIVNVLASTYAWGAR